VSYTLHTLDFGQYVRRAREELASSRDGRTFSLRSVARSCGVEPAYLSKIERGEMPPPSEALIVRLAERLGEDPDFLLALGGKVSSDLLDIIRSHPTAFAAHLRALRTMPEERIARLTTDVRDGKW
jgi:HTH-type transcriptional regulator, competence development regulator